MPDRPLCARLTDHPGHWVTTRTLLGSRKRWCKGHVEIEGGSPARKGRQFGAEVKVSAEGKRSRW